MGFFSRSDPAQATQSCKSACCAGKQADDQLSQAAGMRMGALSNAGVPNENQMAVDEKARAALPANASPCQKKAVELAPTLARFERYRKALPYAKAAHDMNKRTGQSANDEDKSVKQECLTRLPANAEQLNKELGLPPGTIKPGDLRQDDSGFRAALYRDDATGKLILVARDTNPNSLVDWQTNTRNGQGLDTDQYSASRELSRALSQGGVSFDVAGYSKGGGLAQEMALVNPQAQAYVFNSAGLHEASLARTGNTDFNSLVNRTRAFSADNEFLTYMNGTTDPAQQVANARFLRRELQGDHWFEVDPLEITHRNPANPKGDNDPAFAGARDAYFKELDGFISGLEADRAAGRTFSSFPPVRAAQKETVVGSMAYASKKLGAENAGPNLGKLNQHLMENVLDPMKKSIDKDRDALQSFLKGCR
jgi:hypothetical protein